MNTLPKAKTAVIPKNKFTMYALNPDKDKDKSIAFDLALGYNKNNDNVEVHHERSCRTIKTTA